MTVSRKQQIPIDSTPYNQCISHSNAKHLPFIGTDSKQNGSLTGIAFEQKDYYEWVEYDFFSNSFVLTAIIKKTDTSRFINTDGFSILWLIINNMTIVKLRMFKH